MRYDSPIGGLTIVSDGKSTIGLWIDNQKYFGSIPGPYIPKEDLPVFAETRRWLNLYFSGKQPDFLPPIHTKGSAFQEAVWAVLRTIPYGKVTTYGKIAKCLEQGADNRVSAQAVGGAVAHNPVSLLIPCHRVIGTDGSLTGYAGGMEKKAQLLALEGIKDLKNERFDP